MYLPHFCPLIGNEPAKILLDNIAQDPATGGRVLLLSGPARIGKSAFALAFIKAKFGKEHEWKVQEGVHPDVKWLKPEGKSHLHLVESIEKMQKESFLSPLEAREKIYVIEEVDRMLPASSNALLKILEEPPIHATFILLTAQEEHVLPTILSRCFKISFHPIGEEALMQALVQKGCDQEKAQQIALLSQGSYSKACAFLEGIKDPIREHFREILSHFFLRRPSLEFIQALTDLDKLIEKKGGEEAMISMIDLLLEDLLYWLRDLHCFKITGEEEALFHRASLQQIAAQAQGTIPSLEKGLSYIEQAKMALQRHVKLKVVLEHIFLKVAENSLV